MGSISRPAQTKQYLTITDCPVCKGEIQVKDFGYSSFNPGVAYCRGGCSRKWDLGWVNDQWAAGLAWNRKAKLINSKLEVFRLLKIESATTQKMRDAALLLDELKEAIVGGVPIDG